MLHVCMSMCVSVGHLKDSLEMSAPTVAGRSLEPAVSLEAGVSGPSLAMTVIIVTTNSTTTA